MNLMNTRKNRLGKGERDMNCNEVVSTDLDMYFKKGKSSDILLHSFRLSALPWKNLLKIHKPLRLKMTTNSLKFKEGAKFLYFKVY